MAKPLREDDLAAIEAIVRAHAGGISVAEIADALKLPVPRRTLQYRLKSLVESGRIAAGGEGRGAKYRMPAPSKASAVAAENAPMTPEAAEEEEAVPLSPAGKEIRRLVLRVGRRWRKRCENWNANWAAKSTTQY